MGVDDDVWRSAVGCHHRKHWRGRDYQRRKQRDGRADIAIMMTEAMVVRFGGISRALVRVGRCLNVGACREFLGVNMPERQRELDRQRTKRQPAPEPH
jgi:hypothetical protein